MDNWEEMGRDVKRICEMGNGNGIITVEPELTVKRETQRKIPKMVTRNPPL